VVVEKENLREGACFSVFQRDVGREKGQRHFFFLLKVKVERREEFFLLFI
jgi:hypothetical protein